MGLLVACIDISDLMWFKRVNHPSTLLRNLIKRQITAHYCSGFANVLGKKRPKTGLVFEAHFLVLLRDVAVLQWLQCCYFSHFNISHWYQYGENRKSLIFQEFLVTVGVFFIFLFF